MRRLDSSRVSIGTLILSAGFAAAGSLAIAGGTGLLDQPAAAWDTGDMPPVDVAPADLAAAESLSRAFAAVSERIAPAVVSIEATQTVRARPRPNPFGGAPGQPREFQRGGEGSGFVVRADGYIVTNNHVVENADRVRVRFNDGRTLAAEIVGTDAPSDLAVLRVEATDLTAVPFGDAEALRVGQWVVAAGNPFGLGASITAGIVSATGRGIGINRYENYIQTDAAINPGNSGGPLLNLRGQVIGVNTAILSRTGGNVGIGFAIPSDLVTSVVEQLISGGAVRRGYLGVLMADLNDRMARGLGYDGAGVVVREVTSNGPAEAAGLAERDIITSVDGEAVGSPAELGLLIASRRPGDKIILEVVRERQPRKIVVTLEEFTEELMAGRVPAPAPQIDPDAEVLATTARLFGVDLQMLTPELERRLGLSGLENGLVVVRVQDGSRAAAAGLRAGNVIVEAENRAVENLQVWKSVLDEADRSSGILLSVRSGESSRIVVLGFPD
jgi:serine protease Do